MHSRLLLLGLILLCSCNAISEEDLCGDWLVTKITYRNRDIVLGSQTVKVSLVPVGYNVIGEISFLPSGKAHLPGIETQDLPIKWQIRKGKLVISTDTVAIETQGLEELSTLRFESAFSSDLKLKELYNLKRDSFLKLKGVKSFVAPIEVYSGTYEIQKTREGLLLHSELTIIELVNKDKAFRKAIDRLLY